MRSPHPHTCAAGAGAFAGHARTSGAQCRTATSRHAACTARWTSPTAGTDRLGASSHRSVSSTVQLRLASAKPLDIPGNSGSPLTNFSRWNTLRVNRSENRRNCMKQHAAPSGRESPVVQGYNPRDHLPVAEQIKRARADKHISREELAYMTGLELT